MKTTKMTFAIIIAAILIAAMYFYRDTMELPELFSYFIGAGGSITAIYAWLTKNEKEAENVKKDQEITQLRGEFKKAMGMNVDYYRATK